MSKDNLHRKVKIDYSVLRDLLSIYLCSDGTNMVIEYSSLYNSWSTNVPHRIIKKARNILENS